MISGTELKYAIKKATTWGTPVACGANNGILVRPTSIKRESTIEVDNSLGLYFSSDGTPGAIKVEGDIPMYLRYDSCDLIIALFMGTSTRTLHTGATNSYDYTYSPSTNIDGLFATFCKHMKNYIAEIPSAKIDALTIKGEVGKPIELIAHIIGDTVNYNTSSGTNTLTTFNNVTFFEVANRVMFSQGVFRMNSQSESALSDTNKIYPSSFELTMKRKLTGVYGKYVTNTNSPQDIIDEPTNDGAPEFSLKLTFPRHTGNTRLIDLGNDVRYKMDIKFTGAIIESTIKREITIEIPHLQIKNIDVVDEEGIIKEPIEFILHSTSTPPTGMTATTPVKIMGINKLSTNPI